jgi:predicted transcriptional regulator
MKLFTTKLDEDLYDKIRVLAIKRKKKILEIINEALIDILKKYENE